MASTPVSLTRDEIEKIRSLYGMAWGHDSPVCRKLTKAMARVDAKERLTDSADSTSL